MTNPEKPAAGICVVLGGTFLPHLLDAGTTDATDVTSCYQDETNDILSYARGLLGAVKVPIEKQESGEDPGDPGGQCEVRGGRTWKDSSKHCTIA